MKKLLFLLILLSSTFIFSQKRTGIATYQKKIIKIIDTKEQEELKKKYSKEVYNMSMKMVEEADTWLKNTDFLLNFSNSASYYYFENSAKVKLPIMVQSIPFYYLYLPNKEFITEQIFSHTKYLVSSKLDTNWKISRETKRIENYTCLKATRTIKSSISGEDNESIIIAWFTP